MWLPLNRGGSPVAISPRVKGNPWRIAPLIWFTAPFEDVELVDNHFFALEEGIHGFLQRLSALFERRYDRRFREIRKRMEEKGIDVLILYGDSGGNHSNHANVKYVSNYKDPISSYVVFPLRENPVCTSRPVFISPMPSG